MDISQLSNQELVYFGIFGAITIFVLYSLWKQRKNIVSENTSILTIHGVKKNKIKIINDIKYDGESNRVLDNVTGTQIDLNGTDEIAIFIGTGSNRDDALIIEKNGKFIDIIDQTNLSSRIATYASISTDIDHNGLTDLIVAREDGVTLYLNQGRGKFKVSKIMEASRETIPVSLTVTDYNKDGHADIYVSQKVHPKLAQNKEGKHNFKKHNVLLEGLGIGAFEDVTHLTGTEGTNSDTKSATWVDLDQDKLPDLVLSQDNGEIEVYKNTRGASGGKFIHGPEFIRMKVPTSTGYWTSVKPNDQTGTNIISNTGELIQTGGGSNQDLSSGDKMVKTKILLKNSGINLTEKTLNQDENIGWLTIMEKLDFDGAWNKIMGDSNNEPVSDNKNAFWLNISGPTTLLKNKKSSWIGVRLPDGTPFYNATLYVDSINDNTGKVRKQTRQNSNGSGKIITFDLGDDTRVLHLEVNTIYDGNRWIHPNPKINKIATFRNMKSNNYTAR